MSTGMGEGGEKDGPAGALGSHTNCFKPRKDKKECGWVGGTNGREKPWFYSDPTHYPEARESLFQICPLENIPVLGMVLYFLPEIVLLWKKNAFPLFFFLPKE